ncbi:hypothetical protein [Tritonibacter mobilis]|uniref:hypothetical protein n=1 Tax=Tritonibacter mobilis TaxID=379347 RepID=UPI001CD97F00|nr:hypothetical protein [Tritonibacter mobilis]MCA2008023.1 hypothetical protein [Tritonibacter mobilis]
MSDRYKIQSEMIGRILEFLEDFGIEPTTIEGSNFVKSAEELGLLIIAMNWLIAEEIIRVDASRGEGRWIGCQLSARGMYLLGRTINIGGDFVPMREAVREAQKGSWDHTKMGDFIGGIFGGAIKSLTS